MPDTVLLGGKFCFRSWCLCPTISPGVCSLCPSLCPHHLSQVTDRRAHDPQSAREGPEGSGLMGLTSQKVAWPYPQIMMTHTAQGPPANPRAPRCGSPLLLCADLLPSQHGTRWSPSPCLFAAVFFFVVVVFLILSVSSLDA